MFLKMNINTDIKPLNCFYCNQLIINENYLTCSRCKKYFEIKCLKRGTPGDFYGDIFFKFTCSNCSKNCKEFFLRQKLPWFMIIILAIYNISIKSNGLGQYGFFHWRSHIGNFIDKNWSYLFGTTKKQRKNWVGTVSGILSTHSPEYFCSGQGILNETGWWKLSQDKSPKYFFETYRANLTKKQNESRRPGIKRFKFEEDLFYPLPNYRDNVSDLESDDSSNESRIDEPLICSRHLPYMGKKQTNVYKNPLIKNEPIESVQMTKISTNTFEFENFLKQSPKSTLSSGETLDRSEICSKEICSSIKKTEESKSIFCTLSENHDSSSYSGSVNYFESTMASITNFQNHFFGIEENSLKTGILSDVISKEPAGQYEMISENFSQSQENLYPKILQVTNFQNEQQGIIISENNSLCSSESATEENSDDDKNIEEYQCKSLFTKSERRPFPWKNYLKNSVEEKQSDLKFLTEREEKQLLSELNKILSTETKFSIPEHICRFYRKLKLRELKRQIGKPLFNIEDFNSNSMRAIKSSKILDRFTQILVKFESKPNFTARLMGHCEPEIFESPYTLRSLHPYIFRSEKCFPQWLKLLCEIEFTKTGCAPIRSTIDYCYVRPYHIAGINNLLEQMFWKGIDMSECLSYPDFTVVALYKKLIIGCAFLVPDVSFNEAYISFMAVRPNWQRSGVATFMLYHLTQSTEKDITLHVSASNPAICIYQKFGFKIEEVILDFYEKYLPITSKESRNAFFLRLKR